MSNKINALILGDLILDTYVTGEVNRISPEAPVPILLQKDNYHVLGGALNVTQNLCDLGVNAIPIGLIGDDFAGKKILSMLKDEKIETTNILPSKNYVTSEKTRFSSNNHHLLRLDKEIVCSKKDWNDFFVEKTLELLNKIDFLLISDYGKGVCNENVLKEIIKACNDKNINVFVDPKGKNYTKYQNSFCITPNKNEAELIIGKKLLNDEDFEKAAKQIAVNFKIENCIITRGSDGLTCFDGKKTFHIQAIKVDVFDVSGAGDKFISVLAHKINQNESIFNSCKYANFEAGESVKYFGTRKNKKIKES